jgi:hypothetical protein
VPLPAETRFVRRDDVLAERVLEETVLLDPVAPRYVRLNATGALLWDALAEPQDADELAARLEGAFPVDRERARGDARALLDALVERGLVREA